VSPTRLESFEGLAQQEIMTISGEAEVSSLARRASLHARRTHLQRGWEKPTTSRAGTMDRSHARRMAPCAVSRSLKPAAAATALPPPPKPAAHGPRHPGVCKEGAGRI
jgi:hypothetical protein